MKKKLVKGLLTLSLAGALALSGVTTSGTGLNAVEAAKVVAKTELSAVTGIGYDSEDEKIYWNSVKNATRYYITVTDSNGYEVCSSYSTALNDYVYLSSGTYNVTIKAVDKNNYYVVADDATWSSRPTGYSYEDWDYEYKGDGKYTFYKHPSSVGTGQIVVQNNAATTVKNSITQIPSIQLKEVNTTGIKVKPSSNIALNYGEEIYWEYSNNAQFVDNDKDLFVYTMYTYYNNDNQTKTISFSNFLPGDTIYVRARVYNPYYQNPAKGAWVTGGHRNEYDDYTYGQYWSDNTLDSEKYSAYSNVLKYSVKNVKISSVSTTVDASSVTLKASALNGATGYQFAKKVGSKWVTLDTQTDPCYVDTGLAKNTKYQYRVRAYTYNENTKKTVWSEWYTVNTTTWGSNLNLKAAAQSATSVKLTWKPVSNAEGYEIYRCDTDSYSINIDKGVGVESFESMSLVKTIKKAKTKSYTDKKLNKNANYTYLIRAYRTIGKQKIYIQDYASISLRPGGLYVTTYKTSAGKVVATWNKMSGIKGYYVEKYDRDTDEYVKVKTLKASATSYTFSKVNVGVKDEEYRIRPYDSTAVYEGSTITVSGTLAAPTNVKVVKTSNGVQVSWKAVAGADYYRVYRTTNGSYQYDKTAKTYSYSSGTTVYEGAVNTQNCKPELGESGYKEAGTYSTEMIRGTSVEDKALVYMARSVDANDEYIKVGTTSSGETVYQTEERFYNNIEGPEAGATYYYYVVAYAQASNGLNGKETQSAESKAAKITYTNAAAKKVSKITSVKSSKKGQATVSFKKVKGVAGYAIYRSTKKNGTYVLVGTSTKASFTDASAPSGKTCYYKVASFVKGEKKANIYSAKTAAKSVKVK